MKNFYLTKDVGDSVKDVDEAKGIVTGYFSVFGNVDSDGDIIMPGAYSKSLKENGPGSTRPRILHLYQHDPSDVLAKPSVLREDGKGLYFESKISQTTRGRDVIRLYLDGVLTEHSIGFQVVKREVDEEKEVQRLTELKLWEGSTVSWGANSEALVSGVKSENLPDADTWEKLTQKLEALNRAVKGNYTDDTARMLEIQLQKIQQLILTLAMKVKPEQSTSPADEPLEISAEDIVKRIMKNIKQL